MHRVGRGLSRAATRTREPSLIMLWRRGQKPVHIAEALVTTTTAATAAAGGGGRGTANPGSRGWVRKTTTTTTAARHLRYVASPKLVAAIPASANRRVNVKTNCAANGYALSTLITGFPSFTGRSAYFGTVTRDAGIRGCLTWQKAAPNSGGSVSSSSSNARRTFSSDCRRTAPPLFLSPRMVCFCFHRNKVGPLRQIEIPDITAVPEGAASVVDDAANTVAADSGSNREAPPAVEEASSRGASEAEVPVISLPKPDERSESQTESAETPTSDELSASVLCCQSSPTSQDSSSSAPPVPGSSALRRDPSCFGTIFSPEERSAISDLGYEGVTVDGAGEETVGDSDSLEKPIGPGPAETDTDREEQEGIKVSKRTFGCFDVYSPASDRPSDAARADPKDAEGDAAAANERPLVIMIPWLNAQPRHVQKYNELYVNKGMDVLHMHVTPMQILRPLRTKKVIGQLLALLTDKEGCFADRPIIVHGFSIGAFVWGQMLVEMNATATAVAVDAADDSNVDDFRGHVPQALSEAALVAMLGSASVPDADASPPLNVTKPDPSGDGKFSTGSGSAAASTKPEQRDYATTTTTEDSKPLHSNNNNKNDKNKKKKNNNNKPKPASTTTSAKNNNTSTSATTTTTSSSSSATNAAVLKRIRGVVMDSPTPLANLLDGIPRSLSHNGAVKAAIKGFLFSYLRLFPASVHAHYVQGEEACRVNAGGLPLLMFYSSADVIARERELDVFVDDWLGRGLRVRARKWEDSPHVGHYKCYPEEYREEVETFLDELLLWQQRGEAKKE